MQAVLDKMLIDDAAFSADLESIEAVEELERRRKLVAEGKSHLLSEEESWKSLRNNGYDVQIPNR